jgi:F420-non-reducing hydrogenase iron-sulfur subunit
MDYEPKIVVFCCNWCSYAGADLAGISRLKIKPQFRIVRTMCSGRVDPSMILYAFKKGADGILVAGCHPGDCHYNAGNYKTRRRIVLLKNTLGQLGVEDGRLRLEWISASEGPRFQKILNEFIDDIAKLGPMNIQPREEGKVPVKV